MKHTMIATKAFSYARRDLKVGDEFEALDDKDALILAGLGKARRNDSGVETRAVSATESDDEAQPERKNRRYRRRDLQAEG